MIFKHCYLGPYKEAFVIMARSLTNTWQVPIYINFDVVSKEVEGVKSQLCHVYEDTIVEFEKRLFKVIVSVCDQGGKNQNLTKHYGITPDNFHIPNPYDPSRNVIFIHDFVHEVKLLRNHILDDTCKLPSGKVFTKKFFEKLIDSTKKSTDIAAAAFPLNDYALNVKSSDRQDTGPALKLLSRETAAMIRILFPHDDLALEIADFCEIVSDSRIAIMEIINNLQLQYFLVLVVLLSQFSHLA